MDRTGVTTIPALGLWFLAGPPYLSNLAAGNHKRCKHQCLAAVAEAQARHERFHPGRMLAGWRHLSILVRLGLSLDFQLDFREVILGIAERVVHLRRGEVRIGLSDGFYRTSILRPLINKTD